MTIASPKIGFIGLGIMGAPMAGHLIAAGYQLFVHTKGKVPAAIAESRATQCVDARGVAERADVVFVMVPDTPDVEAVLFDDGGVAAGLSKGKVVVDMSSISPIATKRFARRINDIGCDYLDAPVSGGEVGARNGTLSIMAGGDEGVFARVRPLFELMGKNITLVGGNGDGQTAKVANQIIVALNIEAVAEALLFAARVDALRGARLGDGRGHLAARAHEHLVAGLQKVLRHRRAHDAESDESDFHDRGPFTVSKSLSRPARTRSVWRASSQAPAASRRPSAARPNSR